MGELELAGDGLIVREGSHSEDPDRDIIELVVAERAAAALRVLMQRHGTAVYRYCREELRDAALAEDIHQQVFIQAHRDLQQFAGRATVRTWLFAIARNRVLDAAKARRRAMAHVEQDDDADAPVATPSAGEQIDEARLQEALVGCVARLSPSMRTALLLRYQQGFTFAEMARICGEKPGTLQARVTRALPLLRRCIEAASGGEL